MIKSIKHSQNYFEKREATGAHVNPDAGGKMKICTLEELVRSREVDLLKKRGIHENISLVLEIHGKYKENPCKTIERCIFPYLNIRPYV